MDSEGHAPERPSLSLAFWPGDNGHDRALRTPGLLALERVARDVRDRISRVSTPTRRCNPFCNNSLRACTFPIALFFPL